MTMVMGAFTGCKDYDDAYIVDRVNNHEERISSLEEWQKTVNTNISSLQQIINELESYDCVVKYTELADGAGYTLTFKSGKEITITNGHSPVISVALGSDGRYYWTLDGEYVLDGDGNKMAVTGNDGKDGKTPYIGTNGNWWIDGTDTGESAVAPQVKIGDDNYWYISTDGGTTWTKTGSTAKGEKGDKGDKGDDGADGSDGSDGDAFFKSVTAGDSYITMVLNDGKETTIKIPYYDKNTMCFEGCHESASDKLTLKKEIDENIYYYGNKLTVILPEDLTVNNYANLVATIVPVNASTQTNQSATTTRGNGQAFDISVTLGEPDLANHKVEVTVKNYSNYFTQALVHVMLTYTDKTQLTASRLVEVGQLSSRDIKVTDIVTEDGCIFTQEELSEMTDDEKRALNPTGIVVSTDPDEFSPSVTTDDFQPIALVLDLENIKADDNTDKFAWGTGGWSIGNNNALYGWADDFLDYITTFKKAYDDNDGYSNCYVKTVDNIKKWGEETKYPALNAVRGTTDNPWKKNGYPYWLPSIGEWWRILANLTENSVFNNYTNDNDTELVDKQDLINFPINNITALDELFTNAGAHSLFPENNNYVDFWTSSNGMNIAAANFNYSKDPNPNPEGLFYEVNKNGTKTYGCTAMHVILSKRDNDKGVNFNYKFKKNPCYVRGVYAIDGSFGTQKSAQ